MRKRKRAAIRERGCWVFICFGYRLAERGKGMRDESSSRMYYTSIAGKLFHSELETKDFIGRALSTCT